MINTEHNSYLTSSILTNKHGFSKRNGGVSCGVYESLNLGMNRGDNESDVIKNWQIFLNDTGIGYRKIVYGLQVHENYVHIAGEDDARFPYDEGEPIHSDGYVTNVPNLPLVVFTADCVPILMEDASNGIVGAIHSGWRSTVADIAQSAINAFISLSGNIDTIKVAIGPSIGRCCFEVGSEVIDACNSLLGHSSSKYYTSKTNGKYMLDLQGVVKERFVQLGINPDNIEKVGDCTMCHPDLYYSHRYSNGIRGSLASVISLSS